MTYMNQIQLAEVLKLHVLWLVSPKRGTQANLYGVNLSKAVLNDADLSLANLRDADLSQANLRDATLSGANLRCASLCFADLTVADLSHADLSHANLTGANLRNANLYNAYLTGADLRNANLSNAILFGANLTNVDLRNANLFQADLHCADLSGAKLPNFQLCPQTGTFEAYKKVRGNVVLKLLIEGPRTSSLVGRKCRTSKAFVVEACNSEAKEFKSLHDPNFIYKIGEYVEVSKYNPDIRIECTSGIHFFLTREEAENYS